MCGSLLSQERERWTNIMKSFKYNTHTAMFFGQNCIRDKMSVFENYGKRALVVTSRFPDGCRNYAVEDLEQLFKDMGVEYLVWDKVIENPPVESVVEAVADLNGFKPDFIVGAGGGSSIDTAKAVALLLKHEGEDPYKVFYVQGGHHSNAIKSEADIPVIAVPTTAGTGAEVTPYAVLTRSDVENKQSMYPLVFADAAFLDSRYIKESPMFLIHTGAIDALAHGVESYLHTGSNPMNRAIGEIGFKMFASYKDNLLSGKLTDEDYDTMILTSFVMGISFCQCSTSLPHGMSYPLSHFKGVNHGLACGITLGEYLKTFRDQSIVQPVCELCGFRNSDEFAEYVHNLIKGDIHIEVTEQEIQDWTDEFVKAEFRLKAHPEPITREQIVEIYRNALKPYLVG